MSTELTMLVYAGLLTLVQVGAQSFALKHQAGNAYTVGARDAEIRPGGLAGRLERALRNLLETLPVFVIFVLATELSGRASAWTGIGAQVFFWGRLAYLPIYAAGIPWIRSLIWCVASAGLAAMAWGLLAVETI